MQEIVKTSNILPETMFISKKQMRDAGEVLEKNQDEQLVLVKYGSTYIHLHTCRLALTRTTETTHNRRQK